MPWRPITGSVDEQVAEKTVTQIKVNANLHTSLAYASADDHRQLGIWDRSVNRQAKPHHLP